nr:ORF193 [Cyanidium sp. THAL103]
MQVYIWRYMNKFGKSSRNFTKIYIKFFIIFVGFIFIVFLSWIFQISIAPHSTYKIYVEFNDINGINVGTSVKHKGLNIGQVVSINNEGNRILVTLLIYSTNNVLSKSSLIEINHLGLLSEATINIISREEIPNSLSYDELNPIDKSCKSEYLICDKDYVKGYQGINYDDLVRATTRISQRLDDPELFNNIRLISLNLFDLINNFNQLTQELLQFLKLFKTYITT